MSAEARLPLTSVSPNADRPNALKTLFPEAFTEGKVDFERLKQALGESIQTDRERYGLNWAGKSDAIHALQSLSVGTLQPQREESVNFDTTENLIIEGDNLEVLKLLQKSYFGKVKMIYIDPPYNTGNEFIYPDNFREGLEDYLRFSGQMMADGTATTSNRETDGRYHSKWLSMMYPRLFLAKNLLREDGFIFISIDDHEVYNLKLITNEIFGEENFAGMLIWKRRQNVDSRAKTGLSIDHEYLLVYGRDQGTRLRGQEKDLTKYSNPDNDPRGSWASDNLLGLATSEQRPNLHYNLVNPVTQDVYPCAETGWRYSRETMARLIDDGRIIWPAQLSGRPRLKRYQDELTEEFTGLSSVLKTVFTTQGTKELAELFDGKDVMDFPKPTPYIKLAIQQATRSHEGDIVLDFFAGSGTTAQAVLDLNNDDGGDRKFILVQLPEKTDNKQFLTISGVTRERVRRVIQRMNTTDTARLLPEGNSTPGRGFKAFSLAASNFKIWDDEAGAGDQNALAHQLELFADNLLPDATPENILFEILLKAGYDLNVPREEVTVAGQPVQSVADGSLLVCLERSLSREVVDGMIAHKPSSVICLDEAFHGDDALLTNTLLQMQDAGIAFQTI